MTIKFSLVPDYDADYQNLTRTVSVFQIETGIEVKMNRRERGNAWQHLIAIATQGHATGISHVERARWHRQV